MHSFITNSLIAFNAGNHNWMLHLIISRNVTMNVCLAYLSACITTINADNSKGINAQVSK